MIYKVGAKVMQTRLTPVLQRIIAPQQFAFLPGRSIHHSLILLGEHQALESGDEHMLLKLHVVKAFDRLEWPYLLVLLDKSFLRASFANAASTVLNGRLTSHIPLTRSVRQGCPLSPLLFIMAFDPLNSLLQEAITRRFPKHNLHLLQNMYADDLYPVIRAILQYIMILQQILHVFGLASGLVCAWEKTVAASIPAGPPPLSLWLTMDVGE